MNLGSNVIAALKSKNGDISTFYGENLITTAGREFYARKLEVNPTFTATVPNFYTGTRVELQNPLNKDTPEVGDAYQDVSNPITTSRITVNPVRNNADALNQAITDANRLYAITYKAEYTPASFNTSSARDITGGCIHNVQNPINTTPLLAYWNFDEPFSKSATDSLTIWVSHVVGGA